MSEKIDHALRRALQEAIVECRAHNGDYHHTTPQEALDRWSALLPPTERDELARMEPVGESRRPRI